MSAVVRTLPVAARGADPVIRPPLPGWTLLEPWRFLAEAGSAALCWPLLLSAPRGDGHPVLVLPGFATSDLMTGLLRSYLLQLGYDAHGWDLGWNLDQHAVGENGEHLAARIAAIREATGRKVSLVGWSLGGVIAREAARRDPADIRQVIALGSPFTGNPHATSLSTLYQAMTGNRLDNPRALARYHRAHRPLPVPSTAIHSRSDGVTAWQNCVTDTDARTENVEVVASHFGMVAHPAVLWAVADRLAQADGEWAPFDRRGPFGAFYPRP